VFRRGVGSAARASAPTGGAFRSSAFALLSYSAANAESNATAGSSRFRIAAASRLHRAALRRDCSASNGTCRLRKASTMPRRYHADTAPSAPVPVGSVASPIGLNRHLSRPARRAREAFASQRIDRIGIVGADSLECRGGAVEAQRPRACDPQAGKPLAAKIGDGWGRSDVSGDVGHAGSVAATATIRYLIDATKHESCRVSCRVD
jgi:hypothetical protein